MSGEARRLRFPATLTRRIARARLSVKLALLSASTTAVVVCGAFWSMSVEARAGALRLSRQELSRTQRTLVALQRRRLDQLRLTATLLTQRPNVGYVMSTYRMERNGNGVHRSDLIATVARELDKLRAEIDADLIVATDDEARVFAVSARDTLFGERLGSGSNLTALPAVRRAMDAARGDSATLSVLDQGGSLYQVAVAPVLLDGFTLGTLVVGEHLDARGIATVHEPFDGEVVVTNGSRIVASTMAPGVAVGTLADSSSPSTRRDARTATIGGDEYLVASLPLGETQTGAHVSLLLLQPTTPAVRALTAALLPKFVLYGALAVLVASLGALLLARSTLSPLRALIEYMRAGAAAERLERPFDASRAAAELRSLSESFGQLIDSLARQRTQLEQRSTQLSAANTVLTAEIQERERVEHALRESEAQLRQSQKLEAIGTLAGGVAHDFNNLLTVISGFTQLALLHVEREHPVTADLRQVVDAADRAARLTHQLLAFSRKQVLQPRVLDLNDIVVGIEPMLRRLIGEHIDLRIEPAASLEPVKADPGQLEQVILNLVVNARDAMPRGGRLTIATEKTPAVEGDGPAVLLHVTDTGTGMTEAVRERVFEPFFTTKEPGKGTGLGLSTVYGIVKQSGGTIAVDSELDRGTMFTITLPAVVSVRASEAVPEETEPPRGTETILLVEDEAEVRAFARRTLETCGYTVLAACSGVEALDIARRTAACIDALLTDIVMPQMSGPQLVERFIAAHPAPCVVYMSGYADDAIMQLELDPGTGFLRKPFTPYALARAIRDALDATRGAPHAFSTFE